MLLAFGLLLAIAFATYYPHDPSLLFRTSEEVEGVRNAIGTLGANIAAVAFGLFGVTVVATPLLMVLAGFRRLRRHRFEPVFGRGFGVLALLVFLPALLALVLGTLSWRGIEIPIGGAIGKILSSFAEPRIGYIGSLVAFVAGVAIAVALLVQSTMSEVAGRWGRQAKSVADGVNMGVTRRKERRAKAKARRKVVDKQVKRARERREKARPEKVDLPLRVTEKTGEGSFGVRRIAGSQDVKKPTKTQKEISFPKGKKGKTALPPADLLVTDAPVAAIEENELVRLGEVIRQRCAEFGVEGTVEGIAPGPVITVFEFQPAPGVKVSQIVNLQDDLALALKADSVRIDRLPGRSTLGIEVPNDSRSTIQLGYLLQREEFQAAHSKLTMAIGVNMHGEPFYADLATMPHLLVAGATGAGKSVGLQSMITSILLKATRDEVQFIFIDPKRVELGVYADIPHLKTEVVVDPKKAANALRWAVSEMERRYRLLAEIHVRSIGQYNKAVLDPEVQKRLALNDDESEDKEIEELQPLPYYVIVIDELADLMMVASSEVEAAIARLAQMARAVGIHLIIATQRPSVDVLTGTIKANFPCRIAYATTTRIDSRTILDQAGAEQLLGRGDALFMPPTSSRSQRVHGAYISEQETASLIRWLKRQGTPELDLSVLEAPPEERATAGGGGSDEYDALYDDAARLVVAEGMASASFLQRRMRIGFSRAARLIDMMERDGLLGPPQGSKPREVLVKADFFEEWDEARRGVEG